jgi:hypothetical protein
MRASRASFAEATAASVNWAREASTDTRIPRTGDERGAGAAEVCTSSKRPASDEHSQSKREAMMLRTSCGLANWKQKKFYMSTIRMTDLVKRKKDRNKNLSDSRRLMKVSLKCRLFNSLMIVVDSRWRQLRRYNTY